MRFEMRLALPLALLPCLLLCPSSIRAQTVSAPSGAMLELTLEEAKRIAWSQNPSVLRAQTSQVQADLQRRQARNDVFLPQFGSGLNFSISRFRRYTAEDFAGEPLPNPYYAQATSSSTSQSVGLSMQLFSYGSWLSLGGAKAGVRQADAALNTEMHRVGAEVERRFYRLILADDAVQLEERFMSTARERFEAEKGRLAAGVSLPADLLGAEIELLDQETRLEQAQGSAVRARLQLLDILGYTEDAAIRPIGNLPAAFDPTGLDEDALVARAIRSGPRMQQANVELENSELQRRRVRAFRWPSVRGSASYSRNRASAGSEAFWEINPQNRGYDLGLQVSIPIPLLRFNEDLSIQSADLTHSRVVKDHATTRAAVEREVRAAVLDLRNAWRAQQSAERRVELSAERARLAGEQHRLGTISFLDFQQINDRDAQARRALLDAQFAFMNARLALEELTGGTLPQ